MGDAGWSSAEYSESLSANHLLVSRTLPRVSNVEAEAGTDDVVVERRAEPLEWAECERRTGWREDERDPERDECRLWLSECNLRLPCERAGVIVRTGGRRLIFTRLPPMSGLDADADETGSALRRVKGVRALTLTIFPSFARTMVPNLSLSF